MCILLLLCDIHRLRLGFAVINVINTLCAAYPDKISSVTTLKGEWGVDLVLPCRYAPGPLASDPANFYHHTWSSILNGTFNSVSSNANIQDNNSDFSLTLVKLNPILAMYVYLCGIEFSPPTLSQPYNLRESSHSQEDAIDVTIKEIEGEDMILVLSIFIRRS